MNGYITEDRLLKSGPPLFFNRTPFLDRMTLREIHITVMGDYRKAVGKFGRPSSIFGKEHHVQKEYEVKDYDLVVEVLPTPDDMLLKWDTSAGNDLIRPKWRVRVARDPVQSTRNLKELMIAGPVYELGKVGSRGPFVALSPDKAATILS